MQDEDLSRHRRNLAPTGRLRATINVGNVVLAQRDPVTGSLGGVSVALAKELGKRLGLEVDLFPFDTAGKAFAALQARQCDIGFLAIDPVRAADLAFTAAYVLIEGTYLVRSGSDLFSAAEVDRPGTRIAAGKNTAYDLFLSRELKNAELVYAPTSAAALETFLNQGLEAAAGVRQPLASFAHAHPGLRVLQDQFTVIEQAMAMPKADEDTWRYLCAFVEDAKTSGLIARALDASGQGDATIAGPASPTGDGRRNSAA
jgi:polar amino acid transport system substrate-binding protein